MIKNRILTEQRWNNKKIFFLLYITDSSQFITRSKNVLTSAEDERGSCFPVHRLDFSSFFLIGWFIQNCEGAIKHCCMRDLTGGPAII